MVNSRKIALTGFGEQVELGLAPKVRALIGKEIKSNKEWDDIMMEIGSSNQAILTLKWKEVIINGKNKTRSS